MSNIILLSIVVPTRNSEYHLETLLKSIKNQNSKHVETIVVDNKSSDKTLQIAKKYNAKIINCPGNAPQVSRQRNLGAKAARGSYIYFMDHDMELSKNFLHNLLQRLSDKRQKLVDAMYIPETIVANSKVLSVARNFEAIFVPGTVVSAARVIKKDYFFTMKGYDENLSSGPADWDLDIQLRLKKGNLVIFKKNVYHHEENLTLWSYIFKKTTYIEGEEIYKKKWRKCKDIYNNVVVKQYSLRYRIFWIFVKNGKWKKLIRHLDSYFLFLIVKLSLVVVYVYARRKYVK